MPPPTYQPPPPKVSNGLSPTMTTNTTTTASTKRGSTATASSALTNGSSVDPNDFITYVIPDFNAVHYFQKDFLQSQEFHILEESQVTGYEIYLVEQWVNNRNIGSVVTAYTGNESSKITVARFTIVKKPSKHYPIRFQEYLNELLQNHSTIKKMEHDRTSILSNNNLTTVATTKSRTSGNSSGLRRRESTTELANEVCFVTNITSLPSNLNLIPIPQGDVRKIETSFIINSNLKKLQCTGRSISLISDKISDANEDKFRQMYKIYNVNIPIKFAIQEVVNVIQMSLFYFDLLDVKYCTGLLCNKTEEAIVNWWNLIGLPHFNVKPNTKDGILPPITVAAIISLILSVRLRLQIVGGCDVPKDPFDFENFMIAIGQFQRQFKLEKTRKLDMETLNKLFTITNSRLQLEKNANYFYSSAYSSSHDHQDFDPLLNPHNYHHFDSISSPPNMKGSSSGQKRKGYGKELKKLTSVVKNTVQDHLNAASRDLDDIQMPSPSSRPTTGRIRNRIAKFTDAVSPLDVESLDLEFLVKTHLAGKVLIRLFYGIQSGNTANLFPTNTAGTTTTTAQNENGSSGTRHHKHHHQHQHPQQHLNPLYPMTSRRRGRSIADEAASYQYAFTSLRDKIAQTHDLTLGPNSMHSGNGGYSKGFNLMKFGLQSRKNLSVTSRKGGSQDHQRQKSDGMIEMNGGNHKQLDYDKSVQSALLDSFLQISSSDSASITKSLGSNTNISVPPSRECENPIASLQHRLNRRNSYPFLLDQYEQNLNTSVISKNDLHVKPEVLEVARSRPRSSSMSCLDKVVVDPSMVTIAKFSQTYLDNISELMKYDNLRKYYFENGSLPGGGTIEDHINNESLERSFQLMNLDLIKLNNLKMSTDSNKTRILDEDLSDHLQYNINLLTNTIDRISYETRIVVKRIDELQENCNLFQLKLNNDCERRIQDLTNTIIKRKNFKQVFFDPKERRSIVRKLTGKSGSEEDNDDNDNNEDDNAGGSGILSMYATYAFDWFLHIFQLVRFNRYNMNNERIRQAWAKLDPNRTIINKAYSYIGKEPSAPSATATVASTSLDLPLLLENRTI